MTFEFFNSGRTAWGKKISGVFNTLELMAKAADERVAEITADTDYYLQFTSKNYRTPEPTRGDLPARVIDALAPLNNTTCIQSIKYSGGKITVTAVYYDAVTDRPITISGTTSLTSGYVYFEPVNGTETIKGKIKFTSGNGDTDLYKATALFKFSIIDNNIYLEDYNGINTVLKGALQYKNFSLTRVGTNSYKATEAYECVIVDGGDTWFELKLNGKLIFDVGSLQYSHLHTTLYLKKGDTVTGSALKNIYKVKYNR